MNETISLVPENIVKQAEENFLISSWSVSAVNNYSRNPFDFARGRIYGIWRASKGVSSAVGTAYDQALQFFFNQIKEGKPKPTLANLLDVGNSSLAMIQPDQWKKTKKNHVEMYEESMKKLAFVLESFMKEEHKYTEDIKEVLYVDQKFAVLNTINGVQVPLPFHFIPDLVYINKSDELCILDHKCVGIFTKEEDCVFKYGNQAVGYITGFDVLISSGYLDDLIKKYPKAKQGVKNFYFYENKNTKNRDGSDQIHKIEIPSVTETRALMEAILYEGVRQLYDAVSDPDHVFLINPNDNFVNATEILDDWIAIQTMEVDCFEIPTAKKELMRKRQKKIRDANLKNVPAQAIKNFKNFSQHFITLGDMSTKTPDERIEMRLQSLGVIAKVAKKIEGIAVDTYLLQVGTSQSVRNVQSRGLDIAAALGAENVYIPKSLYRDGGESYVQVQVANERERAFIQLPPAVGLQIPIGVDNFGETLYWNIANHSAPHAMIAGATGSGKSVCLKAIMKSVEGKGEIVVLDPKYEFYGSLNSIEEIESKIESLVIEMERRVKTRERKETFIFFDELADSLMNGSKDLQRNLQLLLQKGRSCGMHVIAATQRCSAKVLSGDILVNFPVRISFRVPKQIDSMVILGEEGAENLNGLGDGLFVSPETSAPVRFQGYWSL